LVEGHAQLLELTRYVVLNPVRAGLVANAGEWRWSSYNAMVDKVPQPAFLTTGWLLSLFSNDPNRSRKLYADFVAAGAEQHRLLGRPVPGTRTRPVRPSSTRG
jgi:hypothetical protein